SKQLICWAGDLHLLDPDVDQGREYGAADKEVVLDAFYLPARTIVDRWILVREHHQLSHTGNEGGVVDVVELVRITVLVIHVVEVDAGVLDHRTRSISTRTMRLSGPCFFA